MLVDEVNQILLRRRVVRAAHQLSEVERHVIRMVAQLLVDERFRIVIQFGRLNCVKQRSVTINLARFDTKFNKMSKI